MKLGELYSVICIIFATNFKGVIDEQKLRGLGKNWIIVNKNIENKNGHELWQKVQSEDYAALGRDFEALKGAFEMDFFKLISESEVELFYEKCRFKKPFAELKSAHAANMLALLAMIFKQNTDAKSHKILTLYLAQFIIPSFSALATHLQINAKSSYYKALGWFLADFCHVVKETLGLGI